MAVDYGNVTGTAKLLAGHGVDTVICTILVMDQSSADAQVGLAKVAAQSGTVKRFIASDWGIDQPKE